MKKLSVILISIILLLPTLVFAEGTVTQSAMYDRKNRVMIITMEWTGDATDGSVPVTSTFWDLAGYIIMVVTNPESPAPTDNYYITLTDSTGADVMDGLLANRDATNTEQVIYTRYVVGKITLNLTGNAVPGAKGEVKIYVYMER